MNQCGDANYFYVFWGKLCSLRDEMCPEDSEKLDHLIKDWHHQDTVLSYHLSRACEGLYELDEEWRYREATLGEIFGIMGLTVGVLDQWRQLDKVDLKGDGKKDRL